MDSEKLGKYADLIFASLALIEQKCDWRMFDDIILGNPDNRHEAQFEFLTKSTKTRENVLHAGNGWGKTDVILKKHLRYHLRHYGEGPKYKTAHTALTLDQAGEMQDRLIEAVRKSEILRDILLEPGIAETERWFKKFPLPEIRFRNGAMIEFRTTKNKAKAVEGKEYGYISADEVALELHIDFIREKIFLPRLRRWKDSQIDFMATPKGLNAYYRITEKVRRSGGYVRGGNPYENPYIDHSLIQHLEKTYKPNVADQVIWGKFVDNSLNMFASRVEKLFKSGLEETDDISANSEYITGWDLARGKKVEDDLTVGTRAKKVAGEKYYVQKTWALQAPWTEKSRESLELRDGKNYDTSIEREIRLHQKEDQGEVLLDGTGIGDPLAEVVCDIANSFDFRGGNKQKMLEHLQLVIDSDKLKAPMNATLADQMTLYQLEDKSISTDYLMSLAVLAQLIPMGNAEMQTFKAEDLGL